MLIKVKKILKNYKQPKTYLIYLNEKYIKDTMLFNKQNTVINIKNTLQKHGFNLENAPYMNLLIETIVYAILDEIKNSLPTNTKEGS